MQFPGMAAAAEILFVQLYCATPVRYRLGLWLQASDSDEHALLDRDPPERSPPVARQGSHADGLASYSLQQHVIGSTPRLRTHARTTHRAPAAVSHSPRDVSQAPPSAFSTHKHTRRLELFLVAVTHVHAGAGAAPLTAVQPRPHRRASSQLYTE